jgi:hypothetical protein
MEAMMSETITLAADVVANSGAPYVWHSDAKAALADAGLTITYDQGCAVGAELHRRKVVAAINALNAPEAVKTYLLANANDRHAQVPEPCDLRGVTRRALLTTSQYGKPRAAWTSHGGCRLQMTSALVFSHEQASYADHSRYIVPFTGTPTEESTKRLTEFFCRADTHTGLAGSGSNWSVLSIEDGFVVVDCRASICD